MCGHVESTTVAEADCGKKNGPILTPKLPYLIHNAEIDFGQKMAYRWIEQRPAAQDLFAVLLSTKREARGGRAALREECQYISVVVPPCFVGVRVALNRPGSEEPDFFCNHGLV
jgi:hypothetical protein